MLLEQAGLRRFVPAINLSGTPNTVAGNLVGLLERFGPLPDRPTYDALGALLAYLLRLPDLPRDAASQMARLIVVHGLVGDPAYIAELRATYGVKDAIGPAAAATAVAPSPGVTAAPAPAFVADVANPKGLERVINSEDNFLDIFLLNGAVYSAQAVCRIERPRGTALGTGFLIGPDLLLTNQHVLSSIDVLDDACARFGYQVDATTVAAAGREFGFAPGFYVSSPPDALDFALVRLQSAPLADITVVPAETDTMLDLVRKGKHRGYLPLAPRLLQEHDSGQRHPAPGWQAIEGGDDAELRRQDHDGHAGAVRQPTRWKGRRGRRSSTRRGRSWRCITAVSRIRPRLPIRPSPGAVSSARTKDSRPGAASLFQRQRDREALAAFVGRRGLRVEKSKSRKAKVERSKVRSQ